MSFFNTNIDFDGRSSNESKQIEADCSPYEAGQVVDFSTHLEQLALFLAQSWRDEHPGATAHSDADLNDCILAVTTELAIAAKAIGGPVGVVILSGGGSAAARAVCKRVLSVNCG